MLLDDPAEARVAEEVGVDVHRFADAVGVEHDHVAVGQLDRFLLEQIHELLVRAGNVQADHHAARTSTLTGSVVPLPLRM